MSMRGRGVCPCCSTDLSLPPSRATTGAVHHEGGMLGMLWTRPSEQPVLLVLLLRRALRAGAIKGHFRVSEFKNIFIRGLSVYPLCTS